MNNNQFWHPSFGVKDVLFNVTNKIYLWFLNHFVARPDEYYSLTEPSIEWMNLHNKLFWIQPCKENTQEETR